MEPAPRLGDGREDGRANSQPVRRLRDTGRDNSKKERGPAAPWARSGRRIGAWCRRSNSKFRHTTRCRRRSPAEIPATAWPAAGGPSPRLPTPRRGVPAAGQSARARWRTRKVCRRRATGRSLSAGLLTERREARRWGGFGARGKNSKEREGVLSSQWPVNSSVISVILSKAKDL